VSGRAALAALVTALVIGILGMHALASHGTPTTPTTAGSPSAMTGMTGMTGVVATSNLQSSHGALAADVSHATHDESTAAGHGRSHDMTTMAMMCVAMLAVGALTVLLLLVVGIRRPLLPAAFAPAAFRARVLQWVRDTGPPPVWQFSVIRC
jgi:hypothetical protein